MIKNYFKIALRNLLKYKGFSFINITGLAIGIACCIIILLFVQNEISYDTHFANSDRIYRMVLDGKLGENEFKLAVSASPLAETMLRDFPEIENSARMFKAGFPVIRYEDKVFSEERYYWADSNFFDVFQLQFIYGDPNTALKDPNSVVITESTAKKYFGDENPMGKYLNSDNRNDYLITGVIRDIPENSHFHFDFVGSLARYPGLSENTSFLGNNVYTYVLLKDSDSLERLSGKLQEGLRKYLAPQVLEATGVSWEDHEKAGTRYEYTPQPIEDIHLYSHLDYEIETNSDVTYVYFFTIIAFLILGIACINFMNLSTAKSSGRAKEVGIRKTVGSNIRQLITQFLAESVVMSLIAVIFAVIIVQLLLPMFNELAGKDLVMNYFGSFWVIPSLILLAVLVGIFAGSYPAFFLASFKPVAVLGGNVKRGAKGKALRSGLVILQFSVSIVLFIGMFIISDQLQYIQNRNLGFNKDQLIIIHKTDDIGRFMQSFKNDLSSHSSIISVSNSGTLPGLIFGSNAFTKKEGSSEDLRNIMTMFADYDFADTFELEMIEGRYYSRERVVDTLTSIVINEETARVFGLEKPYVGQQIVRMGNTPETSPVYDIIGVVKDFNFESLHSEIRPLAIGLFNSRGFGRYVSVRVNTMDLRNTLSYIEDSWGKYAGNQTFEYTFFDEDFAKLYASEERTGKLFTSFSILAIFIACLGLFGLAAFTAEQRTKEIGIRKALGANIGTILLLLTKEFTKWVLIANVIAWPIAFYVMNNWLEDFAFRIELSLWTFILSGAVALIIAIVTVSSQAFKAAVANPVNSLRYE
ncbi:ABC transporter permease [Bacteroidota bacterium]